MDRRATVTTGLAAAVVLCLSGFTRCEPVVPVGVCQYGGITFDPGEHFPAMDPCNTCSCTEDGSVACTEIGCGPMGQRVHLWVWPTTYSGAEMAQPVWFNYSDTAIYLPGCTTYSVEELDPETGIWRDIGPPADCFWEGVAVRVDAHTRYVDVVDTWVTTTHRLRGSYWTGCTDGQPLSQSGCQGGPITVLSNVFHAEP